MLKSKISRVILATLITLGILVAVGYACLRNLTHHAIQHYEARVLSDYVQGRFGSNAVDVFGDKKCPEEDNCIEVNVAILKADLSIQLELAEYILNACNTNKTNKWPCQKTAYGSLRKVHLYTYRYRNEPCLQKFEINRSSRTVFQTEGCFSRK